MVRETEDERRLRLVAVEEARLARVTTDRVEAPEGEVPLPLIGLIRDGTRWRSVFVELSGPDWRALKRRSVLGERKAFGFIDAELIKMADDLSARARNVVVGKVKRDTKPGVP